MLNDISLGCCSSIIFQSYSLTYFMLRMRTNTTHFTHKHRTQIIFKHTTQDTNDHHPMWCFALHQKLVEHRNGHCEDVSIKSVLVWLVDTLRALILALNQKWKNYGHLLWVPMVTESNIKTAFYTVGPPFCLLPSVPISKVITPQLSTAFHKTGEKSLSCGNHSDGNATYT